MLIIIFAQTFCYSSPALLLDEGQAIGLILHLIFIFFPLI
jgi:hypothetical protein